MTRNVMIKGQEFELPDEPDLKTLRVGDRVKLLLKEAYSNGSWKTYPGIIMSIDNFATHPTINVVYVEISYATCNIKTISYNEESKDVEIVFLPPDDKSLEIDKGSVTELFERQINQKKAELSDLFYKQMYFEKNFGKFFGGI